MSTEKMNMSNCKNQPMGCPADIDPKHFHPQNNLAYAHGCIPCVEAECKDIQEGEFEFTAPAVLLGVCNINKSYLIERKVDGDCAVRAGAIFPDSRTEHFTDAPSMELSLAGDYVVKYKWDACCENEPQFEAIEYPCPCAPTE